jgi:hypothetical protein
MAGDRSGGSGRARRLRDQPVVVVFDAVHAVDAKFFSVLRVVR